MKFLVDTCGWLEWLTDGVLADEFAPYLNDPDNLIIENLGLKPRPFDRLTGSRLRTGF
ncbi:hypothetical protein PA905_44340 [Planktothrix agardhii CCAP 1459/11A]|jgi:hypothetical protein|uniref:Uncharacterized protein n=1 Tax=Planktothrix agardhii CCAP 1459/11A TaxID=282420 RepID=A0A4P5ZKU2_PLAAG|nr:MULTISPECIES: type II toxin-antitoxin system VapC family toxin [Planktothrix]GDZ96003.1 hypothetical protein PA905_44340 [Planktothrix agardhii CCAP 1459/11A]CAD5955786.1 hypothetical protein NO108_03217 [Planktothrix rubescens]CAH2575479.1 hypothetical protein PRNO82_04846 [Planktothrix rubescens]